MEHIIEFKNISKLFPGVKALDDVSLSILKGEIHAVVGENGAGKTTLMNILGGETQPSSGEVLQNGQGIYIREPHTARNVGISIVYQELKL